MGTQITGAALDVFEVLKGLDASERDIIAPLFKVETYAAGRIIFREADPGNKLYFVSKGVIQIEKVVDETNSARLARLGRGEVVGEISLMESSSRSATGTAYIDSELLVLTRSQFDSIVTEYPAIAAKLCLGIAKSLSKRLRAADDEITQLTKRLYYF